MSTEFFTLRQIEAAHAEHNIYHWSVIDGRRFPVIRRYILLYIRDKAAVDVDGALDAPVWAPLPSGGYGITSRVGDDIVYAIEFTPLDADDPDRNEEQKAVRRRWWDHQARSFLVKLIGLCHEEGIVMTADEGRSFTIEIGPYDIQMIQLHGPRMCIAYRHNENVQFIDTDEGAPPPISMMRRQT